jgi:DNA-binding transcriptional ArsR family regulator
MGIDKKPVDAENSVLSLAKVLQAFADPVRLEIVRQLDETPDKACGTFGIDKPKSTMSHHFNVLRTSGILGFEKRGSSLVNYIERKRLDASFPGLLDSILKSAGRPSRPGGRRKLPSKGKQGDLSGSI